MTVVKFPDPLCEHCRKREATKLCDFPLSRIEWVGHPPKINGEYIGPMAKTLTCDRKICDQCATSSESGIDFCPACVEKMIWIKK